ncbi:transcriptional antiterminator NusG [Arthrobacter sp. B3I9]|nr:transcriptional antiterminator NusG [Arthrobacter sp. B3I9]
MSEQELEVTETELDKSQDAAVEAGDESEAVSAAPESDVAEADAEAVTDEEAEDAGASADESEAGESGDALAAAAASAAVDPADEFKAKLRRQEGDWYVIHSYAGYENRVKANLETRIQTLDMEDYIFEIQVPMEEVVEIKNAQRKVINRVRIPGYVLVRMDLTDASWGAVRHTPGVTGFVGNAHNPVPLRLDEVFSMLAPVFEEEQAEKGKPVKHAAAQIDVDFEVGENRSSSRKAPSRRFLPRSPRSRWTPRPSWCWSPSSSAKPRSRWRSTRSARSSFPHRIRPGLPA